MTHSTKTRKQDIVIDTNRYQTRNQRLPGGRGVWRFRLSRGGRAVFGFRTYGHPSSTAPYSIVREWALRTALRCGADRIELYPY